MTKKIYFISLFIFTLQKISENLNKMKIRAFGTQIVIFGILLFISNSVSAQSSSHNTGEPIDKSHHRTTEDTRGNKILSGEMLRRTSIGNLWNAILSLEPSLTDGNSDLYGDVPYYIPQNTSLQGQTAWSLSGQPSSILFLIDGAQVSAYQFMCLNINDIEKIIIYKDAQSLTQLGTKGGNGAIEAILRTPQMGKLHINYLFGRPKPPTPSRRCKRHKRFRLEKYAYTHGIQPQTQTRHRRWRPLCKI